MSTSTYTVSGMTCEHSSLCRIRLPAGAVARSNRQISSPTRRRRPRTAVLAPTPVDRGLSAGTGADGLATQAGPAGPGGGQEEKGAEVVDGADAEGVSEQAAQE